MVVYAKLPRGFLIPTPVGDYNPDWAISLKEGSVKHIYFVAETKGTMSSMKLREIEKTKIACARKFFDEIGRRVSADRVKYDVVTSYEKLMDVVGGAPALNTLVAWRAENERNRTVALYRSNLTLSLRALSLKASSPPSRMSHTALRISAFSSPPAL